jgi:hypothetical protein
MRESIENDTAMHNIIAESAMRASGAALPAAATTGPIVDASEYAGPIDADASTEISKNPRTLGSRRCGSVRSSAATLLQIHHARRKIELVQDALIVRRRYVVPRLLQ